MCIDVIYVLLCGGGNKHQRNNDDRQGRGRDGAGTRARGDINKGGKGGCVLM